MGFNVENHKLEQHGLGERERGLTMLVRSQAECRAGLYLGDYLERHEHTQATTSFVKNSKEAEAGNCTEIHPEWQVFHVL